MDKLKNRSSEVRGWRNVPTSLPTWPFFVPSWEQLVPTSSPTSNQLGQHSQLCVSTLISRYVPKLELRMCTRSSLRNHSKLLSSGQFLSKIRKPVEFLFLLIVICMAPTTLPYTQKWNRNIRIATWTLGGNLCSNVNRKNLRHRHRPSKNGFPMLDEKHLEEVLCVPHHMYHVNMCSEYAIFYMVQLTFTCGNTDL